LLRYAIALSEFCVCVVEQVVERLICFSTAQYAHAS
jgi:hypothetical protein